MTIVLSYVGLTLRCFIAGTFAVAVVSKARNRASASEFALAITTLAGIRQQVAVRAIAVMVVLAETGTVALLALPVTVGPGFALACVSLVAFTAVLLAAIRRGVRQPCRCFGRSASEPGPANVARNLALLCGALAGLVISVVRGAALSNLDPLGAALAIVIGLTAAGLVIISDDLVGMFRAPNWLRTQPGEGIR